MTTKSQADTAATAKGISKLTQFKRRYFNLKLQPEWLEFSIDTPEFELLDSLVIVKDVSIENTALLKDNPDYISRLEDEPSQEYFLPLLARNGINPVENAEIDSFEVYKEAKKDYWEYVEKVSNETGLTRFQVVYKDTEESLSEANDEIKEEQQVIEKVKKELEETEDETVESELKKRIKEKQKAIISINQGFIQKTKETEAILSPYKEEMDTLEKFHEESKKQYEMALASLRSKIELKNLENLHPVLLFEILEFIRREINGEVSEKK
jgi:hypothetical protein